LTPLAMPTVMRSSAEAVSGAAVAASNVNKRAEIVLVIFFLPVRDFFGFDRPFTLC
jgi:hypothetical protein